MQKLSLSLSLVPDNRQYPKENWPLAQVKLKNESDELILVNGRMLHAPIGSPSTIAELEFLITNPPESINLRGLTVNAGNAQPEHFVILLPGEYIEKQYDLMECFYYDQPGTYKLKAKYYNEIDYEVSGIKSWKGELISNEVTFESE